MKHFAIALFAVLMVFSLSGCAGDEKASNSNDTESQNVESISGGADNGTAEQQDTSSVDISDASDFVQGTDVPAYPNSELVYSSNNEMVYATNDSAEKVSDYFKNHPSLSKGIGTGGVEGYYIFETPLADMTRNVGTDPDEQQENLAKINTYIQDNGGLMGIFIFDATTDEQIKENQLASLSSDIPLDKTIILFGILDEV